MEPLVPLLLGIDYTHFSDKQIIRYAFYKFWYVSEIFSNEKQVTETVYTGVVLTLCG
jgi:hypothetical protein